MTGLSLCIFVLFLDLLLSHTQPTRCRDLRSLISSNVDAYIFGKIDLALKILLISFYPLLRGNKTDKKVSLFLKPLLVLHRVIAHENQSNRTQL